MAQKLLELPVWFMRANPDIFPPRDVNNHVAHGVYLFTSVLGYPGYIVMPGIEHERLRNIRVDGANGKGAL